MATIKDVARKTNLSVATVSRVLNNKGNVTEITKKIVEQAIKELDYQPNVTARRLREQKTECILVIVPDIRNSFFPDVFRGIEKVASERGYRVWLEDMQNSVELEKKIFDVLPQKQVDGIISLTARTPKALIESVAEKYPLVIAGQYFENTKIPHVGISNLKASREMTTYLIEEGHKKIAHVTGPLNQLIFQDRLRGYKSALERAGYPVDENLIFEGDYSYQSGYDMAEKIIKSDEGITAVFAANDEMAAGLIKGFRAARKNVPEDYVVTGFDNIRLSSMIEPALTTVEQPKLEMGKKAMEMLFDLIDGKELDAERVVLEHSLVIRESSIRKK